MTPPGFSHKPNYSALAHIYDTLMQDVNYSDWADYIDELICKHAPGTKKILELACGTGTVALLLDELDIYTITSTDRSPAMIEKAKDKSAKKKSDVTFQTMDFLNIDLREKFDVVFMVFDSLNYLHSEDEILELHKQVSSVIKPGGFFIYDFTTPRNSRKAIEYLHNEEGVSPNHYRYYRISDFDARNNIHINEFEIEKLDDNHKNIEQRFIEIHKQKIYTLREILSIAEKTDFEIISYYDGFNLKKATSNSLRITMVLQWQKTQ